MALQPQEIGVFICNGNFKINIKKQIFGTELGDPLIHLQFLSALSLSLSKA
jgi:hypothetical protein